MATTYSHECGTAGQELLAPSQRSATAELFIRKHGHLDGRISRVYRLL